MNINVSFSYLLMSLCFFVSLLFFPVQKSYALPDSQDLVKTEFILSSTELTADKPITIAIKQRIKDRWHTYWKNPGDSGEPVTIKWDTPSYIKTSELMHSEPIKIDYGALASYGYENKSVILQKIYSDKLKSSEEITLTANITTLVCKEICIPVEESISLTLNNGKLYGKGYIVNADLVSKAQRNLPDRQNLQSYVFSDNGNIITEIHLPENHLQNIDKNSIAMHPIDWGIVSNIAENKISLSDDKITITRAKDSRSIDDIAGYNFLLAYNTSDTDDRHIFELTAIKKDTQPVNLSNSDNISLFKILLFAFAGGVILNLMPCVFPVLSMKALKIAKMSGENHIKAISHGFAYTIGVLLSFVALGIVLIILRQAGESIGWGFQLQNPVIVTLLAWLLFAIGLNLAGVFEFSFNKLSGIGSKQTSNDGIASSFFTGILATIVAAPCTAPFMGTAIGYAITQPAIVTIPVFAMLGFGLAFPFMLISLFPGTGKILPKPGAWMETFKQFLSFPLFASVVWLVWVLSQQSGSYGVMVSLSGLIAIYFAVWLGGLQAKSTLFKSLRKIIYIIIIAVTTFALLSTDNVIQNQENGNDSPEISTVSQNWTPEKMNELLSGDAPVFIEMTASWCITCKINEKIALRHKSVKNVFAKNNIIYLVGDWTNRNSDITEFLESHGRNGVPLYVYYGKRNKKSGERPEPIILPQILTPSLVTDILGKE